MRFTGERVLEGEGSRAEWISHRSRYRFAASFVSGKDILDMACGSGYGSRILALAGAKSVTGVDISHEAIRFAQERYRHQTLRFSQGDAQTGIFEDESIDLITSFETIEHLESPEMFLSNAVRMLRKDGMLILSTPNLDALFGERDCFSPYHVHEFHFAEFDDLLQRHFGDIEYYWQRWPIEMPELRRNAYNALEGGSLHWAKRLFPRWLKRTLNACVSVAMKATMSENRLKPLPWSTLSRPEDACFIVAIARSPIAETSQMQNRRIPITEHIG